MQYVMLASQWIVANGPWLTGVILPPLVDIINKDVVSENAKYIITLVICLLVATLLDWQKVSTGNPQTLLSSMSIIFLESQTVFKLYFQNSWVRGKITGVLQSQNAQQLG